MTDRTRVLTLPRDVYFLRGLLLVPLGLLFAATPAYFAGTYRALVALHLPPIRENEWYPEPLLFLGMIALAVGAGLAQQAIGRYYDRRFGRVQLHDQTYLGAGMLVWFVGFAACCIADGPRPAWSLTALWFAALFLAGFFGSGPWRWHYLALSCVFLALSPFWNRIGSLTSSAIFGSAFITAGIVDHLVLTRVLLPAAPALLSETASE